MGKKFAAERRQFGRRETLLHAIVLIPARGGVRCIVTNLSEHGAHITLAEPQVLPPMFRLKGEAIGPVRSCQVRHQGPDGVGVVFVDHAAAEEVACNLDKAAQRKPVRPGNAPADSGARLREELQTARNSSTPPEDMRALSQVPGRVIRGV